jgi:hypothetical protein
LVAGQTLRLVHCAGRTEMSDKPRMMAPMVMPRTPKRTTLDADGNHDNEQKT